MADKVTIDNLEPKRNVESAPMCDISTVAVLAKRVRNAESFVMVDRSASGRRLRPVGEWWIASPARDAKLLHTIARTGISKVPTVKKRKKIKVLSILPKLITTKKKKTKDAYRSEQPGAIDAMEVHSITESPGPLLEPEKAECGVWPTGARSCNLCSRGLCRVRRRLQF